MQQYYSIKGKYPDAILLFRVGDFYETFEQDAVTVSKTVGIVLTKRANGSASAVELAGFPHHALDTYLPKLVRAGFRVAICEQLEDPKKTKKLVKRGVTELVTPGVALNDKMLDHKSNNYLASVFFGKKNAGVAFLDASTGEFLVAEGSASYIEKLVQGFQPSEIIYSKLQKETFQNLFSEQYYSYKLEDWAFNADYTQEILLKHFNTNSLKGFGVENLTSSIHAAGSIIHYLGETEHAQLQHITSIRRIVQDHYVWLDKFTIRNLELVYSPNESGIPLIDILDRTISPMGGRMLKKWMVLPLKELKPIENRLEIVQFLTENLEFLSKLEWYIKQMGDLERLIAKVPLQRINPREVLQIQKALATIAPLKLLCLESKNPNIKKLAEQLNPCDSIQKRIVEVVNEDAPAQIQKGNVIKNDVNVELDELRAISTSGKDYLEQIKQREVEKTGITSLKISFNNVFGYYLEVTNRFKNLVPEEWVRKQTLVNAERYITPELKEYENKILGAEEKILPLEQQIFQELVTEISEFIAPIQLNAQIVARLDCLQSFSNIALKNNYVRPQLDESFNIDIKNGRHPVIERNMPIGENYVPNDLYLDIDSQQIIIITGPNMSGKSAILRQTALIVLMAQMGSFVPADSAKLGITDKIFTRVGASDNISLGESTFMVEMNETASIMNNLNERSLVLLDEIGRGTSTYDGISIAWSLGEFLHNHPHHRPKTLFATHYHELNELAEKLERVKNFHVATREIDNQVIFLRKLKEGGTKHSFGIHVAKMAGMPNQIVNRANEILSELEQKHINSDIGEQLKNIPINNYQLNLFSSEHPELAEIKQILLSLDINTLTPVEALMKLNEIKKISEGE